MAVGLEKSTMTGLALAGIACLALFAVAGIVYVGQRADAVHWKAEAEYDKEVSNMLRQILKDRNARIDDLEETVNAIDAPFIGG